MENSTKETSTTINPNIYGVIASGPSLKKEDIILLEQSNIPLIACNDSWKLCSHPIVYGGDRRWWEEYINDVPHSLDRYTHSLIAARKYDLRIFEGYHPASTDAKIHVGWNSGQKAIELAIHLGGNIIILLGFDGSIAHGSHWHGDHPADKFKTVKQSTVKKWNNEYNIVANHYKNITIINCSRYTEIECFQKEKLENVLSLLAAGSLPRS